MKKGRVELGKTSIRYDLKGAREATSTYNRIAGFAQVSWNPSRMTTDQIVSGRTSPLYKGDLDAIVVFLFHGYTHADDTLEQADVEKLLGQYVKPKERGGKGGVLLDFYTPITEALIECGVVERVGDVGEDEFSRDGGRDGDEARPRAVHEESAA